MTTNFNPALPLDGKTAIVTGASRGIGRGIAWELARQGAAIALGYTSDSSKETLAKLQAEIDALPHSPKTYAVQADLSTLDGAEQFLRSLQSQVGQPLKVDILINNAGRETVQPLEKITVADYEFVYNLNVRGTILLTQAVLPFLQPAGRIINISSVGGRAAFKDLSLYCSSKAALEGLARCWAAELGENGTTVNAVSPGPVQSDMLDNIPKKIIDLQKQMTPVQNRIGKADEVANVVAWLAGPSSGWISGQTISASGGYALY